jgi:hypothetical protein
MGVLVRFDVFKTYKESHGLHTRTRHTIKHSLHTILLTVIIIPHPPYHQAANPPTPTGWGGRRAEAKEA